MSPARSGEGQRQGPGPNQVSLPRRHLALTAPLLAGAPERSRLSRKYQTRPDEAFVRGSFFGGGTMCTDPDMELDGSTNRRSRGEEEKSRKAERSLALEPGLAGLVPRLPARALVLFEFFDAAFNDLGEAYGAAFPLRGLV